jgi:adenine-specific DNA-methyltransferase
LIIYRGKNFITYGVEVPQEYVDEYKLCDENGYYRLQGLRKRGAGARREDRPNMYYPFFYDEKSDVLSVEKTVDNMKEIYPKLSDGSDGRWRWGIETAQLRLNELTVQKVRGRNEWDIFQKDYLPNDGSKRIKPKSFWSGTEFSAETGTLQVKKILGKNMFDTPKPTGIIEYCIKQATDKCGIILDSFAGSGTTAHAVLNMNKADGGNRKFILIEMMDYAENITAERVRRVIDGYGEDKSSTEGTGGGFSYYELGERLLLEDGMLNTNISIDSIRAYVWHMETRQPYLLTENDDNKYFLSVYNDTAYYFYYEENNVTVLKTDFIRTIKTKASNYIIYADTCTISDKMLQKYNITYKKIPRDIAKL